MIKSLKDKQYYIDRYDKLTIDRCRRHIKSFDQISTNQKLGEVANGKILKPWTGVARDVSLHFVIGEAYLNKESTIKKWMLEDQQKDERLESAILPSGIKCQKCFIPMDFECKHLHGIDDDKVLFIFRCNKCRQGRGFFENGQEYLPAPSLCPKCKIELKDKVKRSEDKIIHIETCPRCDYKDETVFNLSKKNEVIDPEFEKDRARFCLSAEEGSKYYDGKIKLEAAVKMLEKFKEKEQNKELYDKLANMKKMTVPELQAYLSKEFENSNYKSLEFSSPEIEKDVFVNFTVQDCKSGRSSQESQYDLRKNIRKLLSDTNWRLVGDNVYYRLGVISGRFRGYDREEDLLKLIKAGHSLPTPITRQRRGYGPYPKG